MAKINLVELRKEMNIKRDVRRGQIYDVDLGKTNGNVQGGRRPCIVCQNNTGNKYSPTVIIVPLSSQIQKANKQPTHTVIKPDLYNGLSCESFTLAEQVKTINKNELGDYIGYVRDKELMDKIDKSIKISLGLKKITSESEDILNNKIKHLEELDMMIAKMLDKSKNTITEFIQEFIDERYELLRDVKTYCLKNNFNLKYYYNQGGYNNIAI